jgi:Mg2+ and Co2+ transporter CorA
MNVEVPGRDIEGLSWFFGIIIGMGILAVILYMYLRRNRVV